MTLNEHPLFCKNEKEEVAEFLAAKTSHLPSIYIKKMKTKGQFTFIANCEYCYDVETEAKKLPGCRMVWARIYDAKDMLEKKILEVERGPAEPR